MFRLTADEDDVLRSQIVILNSGRGKYGKYLPHAFTELGVAMLSSVLKSSRAVQMNIGIMRAFVRMREVVASNRAMVARIEELEYGRSRTTSAIEVILEELGHVASEMKALKDHPKKNRIGFRSNND